MKHALRNEETRRLAGTKILFVKDQTPKTSHRVFGFIRLWRMVRQLLVKMAQAHAEANEIHDQIMRQKEELIRRHGYFLR